MPNTSISFTATGVLERLEVIGGLILSPRSPALLGLCALSSFFHSGDQKLCCVHNITCSFSEIRARQGIVWSLVLYWVQKLHLEFWLHRPKVHLPWWACRSYLGRPDLSHYQPAWHLLGVIWPPVWVPLRRWSGSWRASPIIQMNWLSKESRKWTTCGPVHPRLEGTNDTSMHQWLIRTSCRNYTSWDGFAGHYRRCSDPVKSC